MCVNIAVCNRRCMFPQRPPTSHSTLLFCLSLFVEGVWGDRKEESRDMVSLCSKGWSRIFSEPPVAASSGILGLQAHTTLTSKFVRFVLCYFMARGLCDPGWP